MIIKDEELTREMHEWITYADADELARIAGEMFGVNCFSKSNYDSDITVYEIQPNENYYGAFGEI